jgi:enoyl-CoA hydratase
MVGATSPPTTKGPPVHPTGDDDVLVERADGVMTITINRPHRRNAVDLATARRISALADELDATPELVVGIVTGAGGTFCAGMDLKAFAAGERPRTERGFAGLTSVPPITPLIAAVEGSAMGGGCELALAADLVVAARDAVFGLPEVRRGLLAAGGGLLRLPRRIPYHVAMEAILTGEPFTAPRAYELGLVTRLAEPGDALAQARELAAAIARNAPLAVAAAKRIVVESQDWPAAEAFARQEEIAEPVRRSADAREGARAFAEKRPPVWTGS